MLREMSSLGERELTAIAELERRVVGHDGGRLKLEWPTLRERPSGEFNDLLWWEDGALVGFFGLYSFGRQLELAGMVDPGARRRGTGTALVDRALAMARGRGFGKALLVVPTAGATGRLFALSKGATLDHAEHSLVLSGVPRGRPAHQEVVVRAATPDDDSAIVRVRSQAFGPQWAHLGPESPTERQLVIERHGTVVGTLRVSTDGTTAGIYGFAIEPASQGQGIGREVLRRACEQALADGAAQVTLEVALDNERALGLYTSVGFRQQATEEYWALPTT